MRVHGSVTELPELPGISYKKLADVPGTGMGRVVHNSQKNSGAGNTRV